MMLGLLALTGSRRYASLEFAIWRVATSPRSESNFVRATKDSVSIPIIFSEKRLARVFSMAG